MEHSFESNRLDRITVIMHRFADFITAATTTGSSAPADTCAWCTTGTPGKRTSSPSTAVPSWPHSCDYLPVVKHVGTASRFSSFRAWICDLARDRMYARVTLDFQMSGNSEMIARRNVLINIDRSCVTCAEMIWIRHYALGSSAIIRNYCLIKLIYTCFLKLYI